MRTTSGVFIISSKKNLSRRLSESIISAVEGISRSGTGNFPLTVEKLTIEMGITVKNSGSIDADINIEVIPLSGNISGSYSDLNADILKIEFNQKK